MNAASVSGGWDCHAHLFGPYARYPLAAERSYTPPEAVLTQYLALLKRLNLSHGVLVHPSAYGEDHALLLDVLASVPELRGVVVVRPESKLPLGKLRERGVRAARFSCRSGAALNFSGSASLDDLLALAPSLADAGLHAELWTDCEMLPQIAPLLKQLPVQVVIDHMGGFQPDAGPGHPGFLALLNLLESRQTWVKICAYRNLLKTSDWEVGQAFQQALTDAAPDRLVWGSDWPHLNVSNPPDAADLLSLMQRWAGSEEMVDQILVHNPQALYV
ncbi:MAG: amidohydrolase family protein [Burkholderiaceae bacterium]|jgi:predicted TIM-barrel fold metal-dependent hydrolase|nr:amidohydrolase family protein [Burkholderiaceae bacterium]